MNVRRKLLGSIVGVLLGMGLATGQQPAVPVYNLPNNPTPMLPGSEPGPDSTTLPQVISNWVSYRDKTPPDTPPNAPCTSPIGTELFLRSGSSTPFGSGVFPAVLNTGWLIEGGARAWLYNDAGDAAWTLQASLSNIYNAAHSNTDTVPIIHPAVEGQTGMIASNATIRDLNRTFLNVGLGRDWLIWKPKRDSQRHGEDFLGNATWTVGVDGGVRYGTGRVQYVDITHTTGVLTGGYAAIHSELQIPISCGCTWEIGWRAEWGYTHSNNLIQQSNGFYDMNILLNTGIRF